MADENRGKLKLYMGYAAGVGKTYKMMEEGQALKNQGVDVVIGYFEPHGRKDTIEISIGLESIPRAKISYRGSIFEEMNTEAILARRPRVCLVDEFAHTNIPGSPRVKRWEDVETLLNSGIDVLTTMNVQHLESLNDQVWQITGIRVRETVPDWVAQQADEVVIIDLSPRALLHRLARGVIYNQEKIDLALRNFFRESTLVALREMALRETAHELEHRVLSHEDTIDPQESVKGKRQEHKILLLITANPEAAMLIRRAKRISDFLEAECFAVTVHASGSLAMLPEAEREAIERHMNFARNMRIETRILAGNSVAQTLVDFARRNQITQIFLVHGHDRSSEPRRLLQKIVRLARDMQIVIVSEREPVTN